jgi:hypothetical protein
MQYMLKQIFPFAKVSVYEKCIILHYFSLLFSKC